MKTPAEFVGDLVYLAHYEGPSKFASLAVPMVAARDTEWQAQLAAHYDRVVADLRKEHAAQLAAAHAAGRLEGLRTAAQFASNWAAQLRDGKASNPWSAIEVMAVAGKIAALAEGEVKR